MLTSNGLLTAMIGRVPRRQVRLVVLHIAIVCRHYLARTGNNPERDVVGRSVIDVAVSIDDQRGEQPSVLAIRPAVSKAQVRKVSQQRKKHYRFFYCT
jgi:hypothetical protein